MCVFVEYSVLKFDVGDRDKRLEPHVYRSTEELLPGGGYERVLDNNFSLSLVKSSSSSSSSSGALDKEPNSKRRKVDEAQLPINEEDRHEDSELIRNAHDSNLRLYTSNSIKSGAGACKLVSVNAQKYILDTRTPFENAIR